MELNGFYNYFAHILRPQNTDNGEPQLRNFGGKLQDKNELILYDAIIYAMWNKIDDMIRVFAPLFQGSQKMARGKISTLSL